MEQRRAFKRATVVVIAVLMIPYPGVFAQPLEVGDVETTRAAVETQVERLVTELVARDPELAQEIERQSQECLRDLSDGWLEAPEFTKEIETYRDVQRDLAERVMQETMARDPEGAQHMKEMFEAAERGEMVRPTPEMMERMREGMGDYLRENPEMREYASIEWDRMMEHGLDQGERFGPTESPEQAREAFERWSAESGASQADIDRMRAEMERGFEMGMRDMEHGMQEFERGMDMAREFERWAEGRDAAEVEHYREMMEHERDTSIILDGNIERFGPPPGDGGGGGGAHELKEMHTVEMHGHAEGHWDGNGDGIADHTHSPETTPH